MAGGAGLDASQLKRLVALHGWSGTALAILLYVVMLTGTVVVFDNEIRTWSAGEASVTTSLRPDAVAHAQQAIRDVDPGLLEEVIISERRDGSVALRLHGHVPDPAGEAEVDALLTLGADGQVIDETISRTGRPVSEADAYSRFLVDLHVQLLVPAPWGLFLTGIVGFAMLVAAVSGVLIHKHVLRDIFVTTRPGGRVVSLRDRHTLAGLWGLPFAVLLAFTGAFLSFAISLGLPVVAMVAFGGDRDLALQTVIGSPRAVDERPADSADLSRLVLEANDLAGAPTVTLLIQDYGRADAVVRTFHGQARGTLTGKQFEWNGATGALIGAKELVGSAPSVGSTTVALMAPLHFGNFAGLASKVVWAALGAAMAFSIVTGVQLWLRRREENAAWRRCHALLIAVAWGLPLAMVAGGLAFFATFGTGMASAWVTGTFLSACALLCLTPAAPIDPNALGRVLRTGLAAGLVLLPVARLILVGPNWGDALAQGLPEVVAGDMICLIGATALAVGLLWRPLPQRMTGPAE